jgi:RHS repeat-associated protein
MRREVWVSDVQRTALRRLAGVLGALAVSVFAVALGHPGLAAAEPLCTNTWTGPSEGRWETAEYWSAARVPAPSDVACIGAGKIVKVESTGDTAGVVQGEGTLKISGGSLELTNSLEASTLHSLVMTGGELTGAATLKVSGSLVWSRGTMSGSGTTLLMPGATGVKEELAESRLVRRTFTNEGTLTLTKATLAMYEGATIKNIGTLNVNGESTMIAAEGEASFIINTGTFQKGAGSEPVGISVNFENRGTVKATAAPIEFDGNDVSLASGSVLEGQIEFHSSGTTVNGESFNASNATVSIYTNTLKMATGATATIGHFVEEGFATLSGPGTLKISSLLTWKTGSMIGSGSTILEHGATGTKEEAHPVTLSERTFVNEGTFEQSDGGLEMYNGATFENYGTYHPTAEGSVLLWEGVGAQPLFVNFGTFEAPELEGSDTRVELVPFENLGILKGTIRFNEKELYPNPESAEWGGEQSTRELAACGESESVSCSTGNYSQTQTDLTVGGRGVGLGLTRTYNSQAAADGIHGGFGYGWSSSFSDHLALEPTSGQVTLTEANGSTITFREGSPGSFKGPAWSQDVVTGPPSTPSYKLTLENQTVYTFSASNGRLESVSDRNGNQTTLSYGGSGKLETISDPAGRTIKLSYNGEGLISSAVDPMGHEVKYTYEAGNLKTVTQPVSPPAEAPTRWSFVYDGEHEMKEITDGRGGIAVNEFDSSHRVVKQTDAMKRVTTFEYAPFRTTSTNQATGAVSVQYFSSYGLPTSLTRGYGTPSATTESKVYDRASNILREIDGDGHETRYSYDAQANRVSRIDAVGDETKWSYDATHDVATETKPNGEMTTYKRDSHGNPEVVERPAPGAATQSTSYTYDSHGDMASMTDPLKRTWKYEYDVAGDRTVEIDPEADKRTWGYNEDSQETSTVTPRGVAAGGTKEAKYKTTTVRDAQGRATLVTAPLKHETKYTYDADGNLESMTDPELNRTTYTYDADNERIKVEEPNKTITETGYDGAGQVISRTDGNKHTTKYERNVLEQVKEIVDPLGRKTTKEYDKAGNLTRLTDAAKRTTTYKYDSAKRLVEVSYSDGKTPTVEYEYNADGDRIKMVDGTGTSKYIYDQLDRLTESKDGHGDQSAYEYDLANEQIKITYPNGKAVTRAFDNAGRLKSVTDWLEHTTKFAYDVDSDETGTTFPAATSNEDIYAYDEADAMSEVKMDRGTETLASLKYARNKDGGVTKATTVGLPGEEKPAFSYDENSRVIKGATVSYKYDSANNPTKIGTPTYSYDAADELEKGTGVTYSYDEVGERTKTKPTSGPATSYGYDQAGNLTTVTRPHEGEVAAIEDSYGYNGEGLRTSQTISGAMTYMAWSTAEKLPLILSDGTNSYVYGASGLPIEQIATAGSVLYLHHDQQGSTRMLTGASGESAGSTTYDAYGKVLGHTGASTSPLGYDGQYTDTDTGLIYLRARYYDPATAQLLTVDPAVESTLEPYTYSQDDPPNRADPTGKESPAPEEIAFSRNFAQVRRETGSRLHGETREDFEAGANYYYFAVKVEIAMNNNNLGYAKYDQEQAQILFSELSVRVRDEFGPLVRAESTTGWTGVITSLVKLVKHVYHISVLKRPVSYG